MKNLKESWKSMSQVISKFEGEHEFLSNFYPSKIVYDIDDNYDYTRIKIGDGVRTVTELPFQQGGSSSDATISWVRF